MQHCLSHVVLQVDCTSVEVLDEEYSQLPVKVLAVDQMDWRLPCTCAVADQHTGTFPQQLLHQLVLLLAGAELLLDVVQHNLEGGHVVQLGMWQVHCVRANPLQEEFCTAHRRIRHTVRSLVPLVLLTLARFLDVNHHSDVVKVELFNFTDEHLSQADEERGQPLTVLQFKFQGVVGKPLADRLHVLEAVKLGQEVKRTILKTVQLETLDQFLSFDCVQQKYYDILDLIICL